MRRKNAYAILIIVSGLWLSVFFCGKTTGQQQSKPKRKKFGYSLNPREPKSQSAAKQVRSSQDTDSSDGAIQLHTTVHVLDVLVTDRSGHFINGIKKDDLVVREDGVEQQLATFGTGDNVEIPKSIILIIDYSFSQFNFIDSSLKAAQTLVNRLAPNDQMAIVTDDVEIACDYTNDKSKLVKELDAIGKKRRHGTMGKSLQFSALTATLRELIDADHPRPYVIFQTDGDEIARMTDQDELRKELYSNIQSKMVNNLISKISFKQVVETIEETDGTIYAIIPDDKWISDDPEEYRQLGNRLYQLLNEGDVKAGRYRKGFSEIIEMRDVRRTQAGQYAASIVARMTGAWTSFLRSPEDAQEIYDHIWENIKHRYMVGYYPKNTANDGKKREVRIEVRGHPEYVVLSRTSYRPASGND